MRDTSADYHLLLRSLPTEEIRTKFTRSTEFGMAATGVSVDDAVIAQFNEVKLGRVKAKYITYKIVDGTIVTDTVGLSESFDEFVGILPSEDCRYAIYDMNFTTQDGRPGNKLVFITWYVPDTAI
jgi:cofilin